MTFEETASDLTQNVSSLGFDLPKLIAAKKLKIDHVRIERSEIEETGEYDLGGLFVRLNYAIDSIGAKRVVLDTIESLFAGMDNPTLLRSEIRKLFQWLKQKGVTAVITGERGETTLTRQRDPSEEAVSSLADTWIKLRNEEANHIVVRSLLIVKSRGVGHSGSSTYFIITEKGIQMLKPLAGNKLKDNGLIPKTTDPQKPIQKKHTSGRKIKTRKT